jgi:hypothetical protein
MKVIALMMEAERLHGAISQKTLILIFNQFYKNDESSVERRT